MDDMLIFIVLMKIILNLGDCVYVKYLMQRKKVEAEERRLRQRKAKEEFMKMLEESEELTSSTRWSKAVSMFEEDKRFKAVDMESDREDLFRNYLVDLQKNVQKNRICFFRSLRQFCDLEARFDVIARDKLE